MVAVSVHLYVGRFFNAFSHICEASQHATYRHMGKETGEKKPLPVVLLALSGLVSVVALQGDEREQY